MTDAVQFGDGFGLAGAVIMHLLGQRQQFELLDFSYHVLNVNNFERFATIMCSGVYSTCCATRFGLALFLVCLFVWWLKSIDAILSLRSHHHMPDTTGLERCARARTTLVYYFDSFSTGEGNAIWMHWMLRIRRC